MNVSGISTNSLFSMNNAALNQTAKVSTGTSQTQQNQEDANGGISKDGDTVSISAQGTYFQKTFTGSSTQDVVSSLTEENETGIGSTAGIVASAAASAGISEIATDSQIKSGNAETSSDSESSSDLSQYSESELKQMLEDGEITRQEYNEEIESRQQDASDDSSDSNADVLSSAVSAEQV